MLDILHALFGLACLIGIAWLFSENRSAIRWQQAAAGIALQLVFAVLVLMTPWGEAVFDTLSKGFVAIISFTDVGSRMIFGNLVDQKSFGFIFAFQVLPTVIFFSALMSVLYHLGIMQRVVAFMARIMVKVLNISGSEALSVAANVFIGQTEAPLVVRPYVSRMTQSELLTLMVGGMATIAGGVLAAYVGMLGGGDPQQQVFYAKHLLSASIMAAPATIVIAKILLPETQESLTRGEVRMTVEKTSHNVIEAAANGAGDGLKLALNIAAMLLAFLALIAMINAPLEWLGQVTGLQESLGKPLNLSLILGYLLAPIAWAIGVPWSDATAVGGLIGEKVVINEFVAYLSLNELKASLSDKAVLISTYALCGFANFASIAIQIGGIGGIAPERKTDLARFGLRAVLGGSLATLMTATIAGFLLSLGV